MGLVLSSVEYAALREKSPGEGECLGRGRIHGCIQKNIALSK
jgi:hypothetical protein